MDPGGLGFRALGCVSVEMVANLDDGGNPDVWTQVGPARPRLAWGGLGLCGVWGGLGWAVVSVGWFWV